MKLPKASLVSIEAASFSPVDSLLSEGLAPLGLLSFSSVVPSILFDF